jgi:hypothetical protein
LNAKERKWGTLQSWLRVEKFWACYGRVEASRERTKDVIRCLCRKKYRGSDLMGSRIECGVIMLFKTCNYYSYFSAQHNGISGIRRVKFKRYFSCPNDHHLCRVSVLQTSSDHLWMRWDEWKKIKLKKYVKDVIEKLINITKCIMKV